MRTPNNPEHIEARVADLNRQIAELRSLNTASEAEIAAIDENIKLLKERNALLLDLQIVLGQETMEYKRFIEIGQKIADLLATTPVPPSTPSPYAPTENAI